MSVIHTDMQVHDDTKLVSLQYMQQAHAHIWCAAQLHSMLLTPFHLNLGVELGS